MIGGMLGDRGREVGLLYLFDGLRSHVGSVERDVRTARRHRELAFDRRPVEACRQGRVGGSKGELVEERGRCVVTRPLPNLSSAVGFRHVSNMVENESE